MKLFDMFLTSLSAAQVQPIWKAGGSHFSTRGNVTLKSFHEVIRHEFVVIVFRRHNLFIFWFQ